MIPKTIHYCWFGRNPKPESMKKCIDSWKRCCPDYEIIEWNEDNFNITCNDYVRQAYEAKKWAFVTDFARLWIIYTQGGIYLDTDVELIRPLGALLSHPAYFGFEDSSYINTGIGFGAEKGNLLVKAMLDAYDGLHFLKEDGTYDLLPCPARNTDSIRHLLPEPFDASHIIETDHAVFFPPEYFCPLAADGVTVNRTKNTYSIHWFSASWLTEDEMIVHNFRLFRRKCEQVFGVKLGGYVARAVYLLFPQRRKVLKRM